MASQSTYPPVRQLRPIAPRRERSASWGDAARPASSRLGEDAMRAWTPQASHAGSVLRRAIAFTAAALAMLVVTMPIAAAPAGPMLHAKADPNRPVADSSGKRPDPYIAFALTGAKPGSAYRLVVETSPARGKVPCNGGLGTQFTPAKSGKVAFALEPVTSGTYFPFAGNEPCKGKYVIALDEQRQGDWDTIRRFSFSYPSFAVGSLPLH
jgi:hypothetical protein